jgi:LmbE family N-acetylglucosaminyl deacetylase
MESPLRLLAVLAHPDDESLGNGGTLAKYSAEGVATHVVTATRGERGRFGDADPKPAPEVVGKAREAELRSAARVLGVREVSFLDYLDGELDQAPPQQAIARIAWHVRRIRPQVVITFGPDGGYGHPDHIAISQFTAAAIVEAAQPAPVCDRESERANQGGHPPHAVDKLYYMAWDEVTWGAYQSAFRTLSSHVDGVERRSAPWPHWSLTTRIDAADHWETVWRAVQCHKTQISIYGRLGELTVDQHRVLWGRQSYYRVFSRVNGGRAVEADLFEGIR